MSNLISSLKSWYRRNHPFVAFCLVLFSLYLVLSRFCSDSEKAFLLGGLILQFLGVVITLNGIVCIRKEFNSPSLFELFKGLFRFKSRTVIGTGSGSLTTFGQTVVDFSRVSPIREHPVKDVNTENINLIFEIINNDRQTLQALWEHHETSKQRLETEAILKVNQLRQLNHRVHISGSGLTLIGIGWVIFGLTCSAIPFFIS